MKQLQMKVPQGEWNYYRWGSGETLLVALHGFARNALLFEKLGPEVAKQYTMIALDLPFHGQTQWTDLYKPEDIQYFITEVLKNEQHSQFELIGFSLGGRIALKLLPQMAKQIQKLHLIAPDGLNTSFAWLVNSMPTNAKKRLAKLVDPPKSILQLARSLHRANLLDRWTIRYLERQLGSTENRYRLFQTWIALKHFSLQLSTVKKDLSAFAKPIALYWGKNDQVVPFGKIIDQLSVLSNVEIYLLDGGHEIVNQEIGDLLIHT
ncbi:MAG: alpha/beta hydrolase [Saprospiraceae bacterium]|nr:alpha/beta hydrolase [Saprospiraceae bacterium]